MGDKSLTVKELFPKKSKNRKKMTTRAEADWFEESVGVRWLGYSSFDGKVIVFVKWKCIYIIIHRHLHILCICLKPSPHLHQIQRVLMEAITNPVASISKGKRYYGGYGLLTSTRLKIYVNFHPTLGWIGVSEGHYNYHEFCLCNCCSNAEGIQFREPNWEKCQIC